MNENNNYDKTFGSLFDSDTEENSTIDIKDGALTYNDFLEFLKHGRNPDGKIELHQPFYKGKDGCKTTLSRNERTGEINKIIKKGLTENSNAFFKKMLCPPYDSGLRNNHTFGIIYGRDKNKNPFMIKSHIFDNDVYLPEEYSINGKTVCFSLQHSQDTKSCGVMAYEILKHIKTVEDIQEILDMSEIKKIKSKETRIITQQTLMKSTNTNLRDIAKYFQFYVDPNNTIRKTQPNFFDNPKVNRRRFAIIGSKKKNDKDFYNRITNKVNLDKNTLTTLNFTAAEILKK